jgi:hypothetical protein
MGQHVTLTNNNHPFLYIWSAITSLVKSTTFMQSYFSCINFSSQIAFALFQIDQQICVALKCAKLSRKLQTLETRNTI